MEYAVHTIWIAFNAITKYSIWTYVNETIQMINAVARIQLKMEELVGKTTITVKVTGRHLLQKRAKEKCC